MWIIKDEMSQPGVIVAQLDNLSSGPILQNYEPKATPVIHIQRAEKVFDPFLLFVYLPMILMII